LEEEHPKKPVFSKDKYNFEKMAKTFRNNGIRLNDKTTKPRKLYPSDSWTS
jgi:hypothetical protein